MFHELMSPGGGGAAPSVLPKDLAGILGNMEIDVEQVGPTKQHGIPRSAAKSK